MSRARQQRLPDGGHIVGNEYLAPVRDGERVGTELARLRRRVITLEDRVTALVDWLNEKFNPSRKDDQ